MTNGQTCRTACRVATTSVTHLSRYLRLQGRTRDKTAAAYRQPFTDFDPARRLR